jgi:rhamnosyltransferase
MDSFSIRLTPSNTCALVITYHPDDTIVSKLIATLDQLDRVVVVDNNSSEEEREFLRDAQSKSERIEIIWNDVNLGQAEALNQGILLIKERCYEWVLTLDQDSLIAPDFITTMAVAYEELPDPRAVSLCPVMCSYDGVSPPEGNQLIPRSFSGNPVEGLVSPIKVAITSGNLIKMSVFEEVGLFESDFFIGYVDQEFCLRLGTHGYQIIQSNKSILYHNIGNATHHTFLGKRFILANNSGVRNYYYYRNGVLTYRRHLLKHFDWVCQDLVRGFGINAIKTVLLESNKLDKLKKMMQGLTHGFLGVKGSYPHS